MLLACLNCINHFQKVSEALFGIKKNLNDGVKIETGLVLVVVH